MLTRQDAQRVAQVKLDDARLLARQGRHASSYYLAGYAVEIALKAAAAKTIRAETIPPRGTLDKIFTHDFRKLVAIAGLASELTIACRSDRFAANWAIANRWSTDSRYAMIDPFACAALLSAIVDPDDGVFEWLKKHW